MSIQTAASLVTSSARARKEAFDGLISYQTFALISDKASTTVSANFTLVGFTLKPCVED
jgi:hypothetical protein